MNAIRRKGGVDEEPQAPQVPPTSVAIGLQDHSFTLQAIMEMQKSMGEMKSSLDAVKGAVDSVKSKVEDLVNWKHRILGGVAVAAAVIALAGFFVGKFWDYFTFKAPPTPSLQMATPSPPLSTPPSPAASR